MCSSNYKQFDGELCSFPPIWTFLAKQEVKYSSSHNNNWHRRTQLTRGCERTFEHAQNNTEDEWMKHNESEWEEMRKIDKKNREKWECWNNEPNRKERGKTIINRWKIARSRVTPIIRKTVKIQGNHLFVCNNQFQFNISKNCKKNSWERNKKWRNR